MKNVFVIVVTLAIIFLSLWFTKAVYEADVPNWFKLWLLK